MFKREWENWSSFWWVLPVKFIIKKHKYEKLELNNKQKETDKRKYELWHKHTHMHACTYTAVTYFDPSSRYKALYQNTIDI